MDLKKFNTVYSENTITADQIVQHIEDCGDPTSKPKGLSLSMPDDLYEIIGKNIVKLKGVERKLGGAYSVHPTRMALSLIDIIGKNEEGIQSAKYAAVHDYLEEGDGRNLKAYRDAQENYGPHKAHCKAMVLLSEPELDYSLFEIPVRLAEYIGYYL